ncbi:MAG: hemolysin family protein [Chloroflexota bacterium]|nr:hemolysin family protein [Chloroflexota bacterium]
MDSDLTGTLLRLGAVLLLVLINGFFVAAEFALVSVRPTRIDQLVAQGNTLARTVRRAMHDPNRFISAAQVGITMASLGLGWIGEPALASLIEPLFAGLPEPFDVLGTHTVAAIVAYALITFLHIVLGEQVPKMIALDRAEATILMTAQPTQLLALVFRPFIALLYWGTEAVLRPLGIRRRDEHAQTYSVEELRMLVTTSRQGGQLEASEEAIVNRAFNFADITADQIMVPRTAMVCVATTASPREVLDLAAAGHARLPVYRGTIDNIIGVLHTKDLFRWLTERTEVTASPPFSVAKFMRPALSVPEAITADALLAEMKRRQTHVAIVIDEFGGTAGLVTLEDLMERLVGDVRDEFEPVEQDIENLPDGSVMLDGLLLIEDVNERFGLRIEDEFNNTIGGYIFSRLGRKPELGDEVEVGSHTFVVEELDGLRIARLRLLTPSASANPAEPAG